VLGRGGATTRSGRAPQRLSARKDGADGGEQTAAPLTHECAASRPNASSRWAAVHDRGELRTSSPADSASNTGSYHHLLLQDIPREHGWHLPYKCTTDITEKTDELEDALYKAHDYAYRCGQQLAKARKDIAAEYEKGGKEDGLTFEEFLSRSRSIIADIYKEKEKNCAMALDRLFAAYEDCRRGELAVHSDLALLQAEFLDATMQCRSAPPPTPSY